MITAVVGVVVVMMVVIVVIVMEVEAEVEVEVVGGGERGGAGSACDNLRSAHPFSLGSLAETLAHAHPHRKRRTVAEHARTHNIICTSTPRARSESFSLCVRSTQPPRRSMILLRRAVRHSCAAQQVLL